MSKDGDEKAVLRLTDRSRDNSAPKPEASGAIPAREEKVRIGNNLESSDVLGFRSYEALKEFVALVSEYYGRRLIASNSFEPSSFSHTSRKLILDGSDGSHYFLKQKPFYCKSEEALADFAYIQSRAARALDFVPPLIPGAEGYFLKLGSEYYFLTPLIEGRGFSGKLAESRSSSEALARFHTAMRDIGEGDPQRLSSRNMLRPAVEALKFVSLAKGQKGRDTHQISQLEHIERAIRGLEGDYAASAGEQRSRMWVHGDPGPFNFLFQESRVVGLNDLDNICVSSAERDLAILLLTQTAIQYGGGTSSLSASVLTKGDTKRRAVMRREYSKHAGSIEIDDRSLAFHLQMHWLELMALGIVRGDLAPSSAVAALGMLEDLAAFPG